MLFLNMRVSEKTTKPFISPIGSASKQVLIAQSDAFILSSKTGMIKTTLPSIVHHNALAVQLRITAIGVIMQKKIKAYKKGLLFLTGLALVNKPCSAQLEAQGRQAVMVAVISLVSIHISNMISDMLSNTARAPGTKPSASTIKTQVKKPTNHNFNALNESRPEYSHNASLEITQKSKLDNCGQNTINKANVNALPINNARFFDIAEWPAWAQEIFISVINKYYEVSLTDIVDHVTGSNPLTMATWKFSYKIPTLSGVYGAGQHILDTFTKKGIQEGMESTGHVALGMGIHHVAATVAPLVAQKFLLEKNNPIAFKTLGRLFEATVLFALLSFDKPNNNIDHGVKVNKAIAALKGTAPAFIEKIGT